MAKRIEHDDDTSTVIADPVAGIEPRTELGMALAKIRARIVASGVLICLTKRLIERKRSGEAGTIWIPAMKFSEKRYDLSRYA